MKAFFPNKVICHTVGQSLDLPYVQMHVSNWPLK